MSVAANDQITALKCGHLLHTEELDEYIADDGRECPECNARVEIFGKTAYNRAKLNALLLELDWIKTKQGYQRQQAQARESHQSMLVKSMVNNMIRCLSYYLTTLPDSFKIESFNWNDGDPDTASKIASRLIDLLREHPNTIVDILKSRRFVLYEHSSTLGDYEYLCRSTNRFGTFKFTVDTVSESVIVNCRLPETLGYQVYLNKWIDIPGSEQLARESDFLAGQPGLIFKHGDQFYLVSSDFQVAVSGDALKPGIIHFEWGPPFFDLEYWPITYKTLGSHNINQISKMGKINFQTSDGSIISVDTDPQGLPRVRGVRAKLSPDTTLPGY